MALTQNAWNNSFFEKEVWSKHKFPELGKNKWYGSTYLEGGFVKQPVEQYNDEGFIEIVGLEKVPFVGGAYFEDKE